MNKYEWLKKNLNSIKVLFYCFISSYCFISCNSESQDTKQTDFCSQIHRNDTISLTDVLLNFSEQMKTKTGVYVLEKGSEAMVTRAWLSEYAEQSIDIQYFIFSTDNIGLIACDYLLRAADRGVKIRLLVDDFMIDTDVSDILMLNSHENISIKIYNPGVNLGKNLFGKVKTFATGFRDANQRMHNKTFTVDGKVVITGGRNIADEYFNYDHEYNFRDRDVLLLGKVSKQVNQSFNQFWNDSLSVKITEVVKDTFNQELSNDRFNKLHEYACNPENFHPQIRNQITNLPSVFKSIQNSGEFIWLDSIAFISDIPGKNDGESGLSGGGKTTKELITLIENATTSIDIQTPYLITTKLSRDLFKKAIDRGVKVRILTNSLASTDNLDAFSGYQRDRSNILKTGVRIFEFRPDAAIRLKMMNTGLKEKLTHKPTFGLHAKTMVIDGKITVIGTFNLDPRSANLNTECFVILNSEALSKKVLLGVEEEFKPENSWETTLKFNPDSEVNKYKRFKTWTKKVVPKEIL